VYVNGSNQQVFIGQLWADKIIHGKWPTLRGDSFIDDAFRSKE
jgi:hypothetical protein